MGAITRRLAVSLLATGALILSSAPPAAAKVADPPPADRTAGFVLELGALPPGFTDVGSRSVAARLPFSGSLGLICHDVVRRRGRDVCRAANGTFLDTARTHDAVPSFVYSTTSIGSWDSEKQWRREYVDAGAERVEVRGRRGYLSTFPEGFYLKWFESPTVDVTLEAWTSDGIRNLTRDAIVELAESMRRVPVERLRDVPVAVGTERGAVFGSIESTWLIMTVTGPAGTVCPGRWVSSLYVEGCGALPDADEISYRWNADPVPHWLVGLAGPGVTKVRTSTAGSPSDEAKVHRDAAGRGVFAIFVRAGTTTDELFALDRDGDEVSACPVVVGESFDGLRDC